MRIKSLQITGFKSFVDKTVFEFRPGITAIVGPNGCGKSNVVDAIRWAMGEQSVRRLRGKGMEDVIFAGSEVRSPVGMAEVVITFDNADGVAPPAFSGYSEIQVARRLYRSGESEYLINKVSCRLRDVLDFFRDTGIGTKGYTIVEQGRIAEIVSARPEERRALIEEAAGISKYKARRREAERKLESTEQNLLRVTDVVSEIRRQIGSIERQARKAARYKRLRESQRLLELSLASDDRDALLEKLREGRRGSEELRDAVAAAEARLAEQEARLVQEREGLGAHERAVNEGSEQLFQLRTAIKELESRIAYERRERASLAEANAAREHEKSRLEERLRGGEEEAARQGDELRAVEATLATASDALAQAEGAARTAAEALRGLEAERETANAGLVEILTRIARTEDRLAALKDRSAGIDRRLRSTDEELEVQQSTAAEVDRERRDLEEGLRNLLAERDRLGGALREALERQKTAAERDRRATAALSEARERRETRRARLASLSAVLERREDLGAGARALLDGGEESRRRHGLRGLVRDVLEADREVEAAVEAVLAERAEGIVVQRADGALSALEALRRGAAGRGVFVVEAAGEARSQGFVPLGEPLLSRVRPRPGFEGVARALLGDVNLLPDLAQAVQRYGDLRIPCTFVTPGGDVLTPDGVIRGGSAREPAAMARTREVRELGEAVTALEAEVERCEAEQREAAAAVARTGDEVENLRNRHHTAALAVANHEKDIERNRERVKALAEAQEGRVAERSEWLAEQEGATAEVARLDAVLAEAREQRSVSQRSLDAAGLQIGSAARELSRLEATATERRVQHGARAESRDRLAEACQRAEAAAAETREWITRRSEEIAAAETRREELAGSITQAELTLAEQLRAEEAARLDADGRRDAYEEAAAKVRESEESARQEQVALLAQRERAQQAELVLRESELELQHLEAQVRDRWGVDLVSWKPPVPVAGDEPAASGATPEAPAAEADEAGAAPAPEGEEGGEGEELARDAQREARANAELLELDRPERERHLAELRRKIEAIGEVNIGAIEEHEELRERHRFLAEQKADLENSIAQLREAIARINRTSRKRFRETFDAVNERFQQNFPRLFRGGKANLGLTETEDVLEAGIDIMAQPPGKRLQSVNLLSGGEKTMTAIALLVSVFQVRPSPFFLLDEVDAALDDANVGRFNEIVVELARDSQFLLITHNKRTIEVADILYGVTMAERGVSTLVAVELS